VDFETEQEIEQKLERERRAQVDAVLDGYKIGDLSVKDLMVALVSVVYPEAKEWEINVIREN
jgi:hypothetical protein